MIINSKSLVAIAATVLAVFSMLVANPANAANPQASIRHHWLKSDVQYQTKCVDEFYILVENLEPKDGNYKRSDFKILDMETKQEIPIQIVEGVGFDRTLEDPNNPGVTYKQYTNYELLGPKRVNTRYRLRAIRRRWRCLSAKRRKTPRTTPHPEN